MSHHPPLLPIPTSATDIVRVSLPCSSAISFSLTIKGNFLCMISVL